MRGRLLVDLAALTANYQSYCALSPGTTAAVVKADAYGLGASRVAPALQDAGCQTFFVALAEEGEALRAALPDAQILVFEGATVDSAAALAAAKLIPVINNDIQLQAESVSSGHLEIRKDDDGKYRLQDLNSTNGTRVNGSREDKSTLKRGDEIQLGKLLVQLELPD